MSKNTSFSLGEHFSSFVEAQVGQGRYSSASDVVRAGLRLLEEQEAKFRRCRPRSSKASKAAHRHRSILKNSSLGNGNHSRNPVTSRYTLSPRAQGDLDEIWSLYGQALGHRPSGILYPPDRADIMAIRHNRRWAEPFRDIRAGYYKYPTGSHVLFYRLIEGGIDVVRILHERMDFGRHL